MEQSHSTEADRRSSGQYIPYPDRLVLPRGHLFTNLRSKRLRLIFADRPREEEYVLKNDLVACRAVAMQRPWDERIYQGSFWETIR
jgi:hypothetical protein